MKTDGLDRLVPLFTPPDDPYEGFLRRRARRRRNQKIVVLLVVALIGVASALTLKQLLLSQQQSPANSVKPNVGGDGRIAFVSTDRHDVLTIEPNGSGVMQLTSCGVPTCGSVGRLDWSPDGSTLLFSRFRDKFDPVNTDVGLFAINADGAGLRRLTDCTPPACSQDYAGVWSPDETTVAFIREGIEAGLYVTSPDGSDTTRIASGEMDGHISWSPDSERIAFDQGGAISVAQADGSGVSHLVSGPGRALNPSWSPDGTRLSYATDAPAGAEIWTMAANGTDRQLLYSAKGCCADPVWSPTDASIAFRLEVNAQRDVTFVIHADGSDLRTLPGSEWGPVWSPTGANIAECAGGLVVLSPDGTDRRTIVDSIGLGCVAWQPG